MLTTLSPTNVDTRLFSLKNNIVSTYCSTVNKQQGLSQKWFRCKPQVCSMRLSRCSKGSYRQTQETNHWNTHGKGEAAIEMPQLFTYCIIGKKKYVDSDLIMIQYILITVTGGAAKVSNRTKQRITYLFVWRSQM